MRSFDRRKAILESARYVAIGALASSTDGVLYVALTRAFAIQPLAANFLSVNVGITVSFFLNSFFNFRKPNNLGRRALSFYGVCYVGMGISMAILYIGNHRYGLPDIPVKAASVAVAGCVQFTFNKLVTFGLIPAPSPRVGAETNSMEEST